MSRAVFGIIRVDNSFEESIEAAARTAAQLTEGDGRARAVFVAPRRNIPGVARGKRLSKLVAGVRVLPGPGEGAYSPILAGEEVILILLPKSEDEVRLAAGMAHDSDCPRLAPSADFCSCSCDSILTVAPADTDAAVKAGA